LADSSYWIYLCHLPIVGLVQVDLYPVQASALVKFLVALTVTISLGLASYQVFVRYTVLGSWLHGPRTRPGPDALKTPTLPLRRARNPLGRRRRLGAIGPRR